MKSLEKVCDTNKEALGTKTDVSCVCMWRSKVLKFFFSKTVGSTFSTSRANKRIYLKIKALLDRKQTIW